MSVDAMCVANGIGSFFLCVFILALGYAAGYDLARDKNNKEKK